MSTNESIGDMSKDQLTTWIFENVSAVHTLDCAECGNEIECHDHSMGDMMDGMDRDQLAAVANDEYFDSEFYDNCMQELCSDCKGGYLDTKVKKLEKQVKEQGDGQVLMNKDDLYLVSSMTNTDTEENFKVRQKMLEAALSSGPVTCADLRQTRRDSLDEQNVRLRGDIGLRAGEDPAKDSTSKESVW